MFPSEFECWYRTGDFNMYQKFFSALIITVVALTLSACTRSYEGTQRIIFQAMPGAYSQIFSSNMDGTDIQALTDPSSLATHPSSSPDGAQICYRGASGIYIMDIDGSNKRQITFSAGDEYPTWSPDGKKIAYCKSGSFLLSIVTLENGASWSSSADLTATSKISWSSNNIIYFVSSGFNPTLLNPNDGTYSLLSPTYVRSPSVSPDSSTVLFYKSTISFISISDLLITLEKTLPTQPNGSDPSWSPDSKYIAYSNTGTIYIFSLEKNINEYSFTPFGVTASDVSFIGKPR